MKVNFIERNEFMILGIEEYIKNNFETIDKCWSTFYSRMHEIKSKIKPNITYGFQDYSKDFDIINLYYYYLAAVEVSSLEYIPEGMVGKLIPASKYIVFTHEGDRKDISKVVRNIYNQWFSEFEYELNDEICGDFEYYDKPWNLDNSNCKVDIYIPIK